MTTKQTNYREIYDEAKRRLVDRFIKTHPEIGRSRAIDIVSGRHEEIGEMMDAIEGKR